jgi:uncharacterized LabA/DUF88 family protein
MKKKDNNFAFIDGANLHLGIEAQGWELDYRKFRIYLEEKYSVTKAFIFIGHIPTYASLYKKLQSDGYILLFKPTLKDAKGNVKGNCDADLVLNVMMELTNFDKAIIVSGDGDFYSLIEHLYNNEKLKMLLVPDINNYSALLKPVAKEKIECMNFLIRKISK